MAQLAGFAAGARGPRGAAPGPALAADLGQAASAGHLRLLLNLGQCCVASIRFVIHGDVHDALVEQVVRTQGDVTR